MSKYSEASKARWAKIPKAERTKRMSATAKAKWDKTSPSDKKKHVRKMVAARLAKQKNGRSR